MSNFTQLCVWPGTTMGGQSEKSFEDFFLEEGFHVKFAEVVITNPDIDEEGKIIPGTGGRSDILFYIEDEDMGSFSIWRFHMGIVWWEDLIKYNNLGHLYPKEILEKYPVRW